MKISEKIFSVKKENYTQIITVLGIKLKLVNRKKKLKATNEKMLYKIYKYCSDEKRPEALKDWYYETVGEVLDLNNPQTFNEKLQWLKLYDTDPIKTKLADKYLVREWIKEKIGEEYLIPLLGVWDRAEDIDFNKLPNKFVLKCNHGCGYNIIVKDKAKLNIDKTRKQIKEWLMEDYAFKNGFEMQYSNIPRKVIAEKYIANDKLGLNDYKFICFNGEIKYIWIDIDRDGNHKRNIYDSDWNYVDMTINTKYPHFEKNRDLKPINHEKMKALAKILSKDFAHVRVDFYESENNIFFGEMTFSMGSGSMKIIPHKYDLELGNLIDLSKIKKRVNNE